MDAPLRDALEAIGRVEAGLRPTLMNRVFQRLGPTRAFVAVYRRVGPGLDRWLTRATGGVVAAKLYGFPVLVINTTGARSGLPRSSPVMYARDGDDFLIVGTNFGTEHHPAWTANLLAHPEAQIEVGAVRLAVTSRQVDEAEFARLWPRFSAIYGGFDRYLAQLTHRRPRMFRLSPTAVA